MKLFHPLNESEEKTKIVIEKYKDRIVKIEHGQKGLWFGHNGLVNNQKEAELMTFKNALKRTKSYKKESLIAYHFYNESLGEDVPKLKEYDEENIYNNPFLTFENRKMI